MKNNFILCCFMFCAIAINAQKLSPLELVIKVFTDKDFVNKISKYSTEQYGNYSNATTLNPAYQLSFRLLAQDNATAVVNVTLDSLRHGKDVYIYLQKKKIWKIAALKSLPINNLQEENMQFLEIRNTQIDSLKDVDKNYEAPSGFSNNLAHARIWFALDDKIIDHFKANEREFKSIIAEIKGKNKADKIDANLSSSPESLLISRISNCDYGEGCYDFLIDEFVYSSLGYLYIPDPEAVPKMNDETGFMVLRKMGAGWYFYKKN